MDNNLQSFFNKRYGIQKPIDTRSFGEKASDFFNPVLTPLANALPDTGRPQYVPEDIPPMEEDYSNTINLIKDIANRADISQQTKSDQINRLAQRAQKQQAQILSMSAQPYENFSTYMTKRAGLAAQDLIMAPQRIGTAAGEAIGSFGESVITGKPYEEVLAKNKKNRNELFYLSIPQIEQVLTKYGKGENLIKPSKNIQEFLANTNDMLRRERESQYEMGANLGEAKDVIIQSLMGSDYGKIEVPKEFETVAGISGFIFDAVVDPTNLLPGVGIGVSGTKAVSRKVLRSAISNAENMEDLITAAQKAVVNGVDKKEAEKLFYSRLEKVGKTPPIAPEIVEATKRPQAHEITSPEQISEIYQKFPESKDYNDFLYGKSRELLNKQEAEKVFLNEEINKLRQQPESGLLPINNEVINIPSPKVKLGDVIRRAEAEGKSPEVTAKQMEAVLAENKKIEDEMNQMWEADEKIRAKLEVTDLIDKNKSLEGQRMEYYLSKIPVEPFVYDKIARNVKGLEINPKIPPANMGELMVRMRELNVPSEEIKNTISEVISTSSVVPREAKGTGVLRDLINKPTKPTGEAPPTIISKKSASVSVPEEQVGTIASTTPEKPPEAQISGQAGQGVSVNPSITPAKVIPDVPPVVGKVEELHSLAKSSIAQDPYILYGTKVKVKNQYGEIFEGEVRSLDKTSSGDIVYNINVPELRHSKNDTSRFMADNIIEVSDLKTKKHIELTRPALEEIEKFPMQSFKNITVPDKIINALPDDIENFQELLHEGVKYFYDKVMDNEGKYTKKVSFGNKFMSLTKEGREHVLYHEIGHEVSDRFLVEWSKGLDLSAFGKNVINPQSQKTRFDGISGTYKIGESIAEAYATYRTDPNWLKTNYPEAYRILDEVLSGRDIREAVENKFPIAPSAVGDVPVQPAGDVPVPIKEKVVSNMPLTQGEKRIVEKAIPNKKELLRQIDEAIKKAPDERQYGGELYDARNRGGDEQIARSFYGEKLNIPQIEFKIDGGARVYNTKEALMKFRDGVTKASQSKSKQPITKIPSNNPPIYKVSEHGAGESSDGFIADGIIYYKKDESNFLTPKRDLPSIKDRIALDPTNELKIQGFHLKGEGNKANQQKDFYGGAEWFSPEYMKPSNTFTDYTHHLYLTDKNGEVIVTYADIFQYLASKLKYDKIGVGEIMGIKAPVFLRKGEIIGGVAPVRVPYNPTERLAALKRQFTPDYFEPQVKTAKEIVEASTPTTEEIVKKPYPLADESGQAGQGVEGVEEPKIIEAYQQKKWGILASHYKSLGLNSKEFFDQIAKNTVSTKDGLPFDAWESVKIFKQAQKSPSFILKEFKFTHIGNNSLKIEVISDNGKFVKFIDEKGRTGAHTKSFFESSYKPIKSPTEQLLEAPPAEKNFYEGVTNKEGMVELGAGVNPLKPLQEAYQPVIKPFVKTTETVDAVIRTMDNIAGGKVSQFVNKAFHGDTYREVRKELQVVGQMASQDIASVSDYVASTMTGKLNNDLTDFFANTKRAWSGLNVDFSKKFKTIMETLGDYAEIKQGTGVSTKGYTLLDFAGRREDKMVEKAGSVKGRRRVIPENETALNNVGIDTVAFNTLKKLGFIDKYTLKSGGKGVALTQVGKQVADEIIKYSGKTPEELAKFMKKVDRFVAKVNKGQVITLTPEVVDSIKKLPNLVDVSPMNIGIDVRKIAKYALDEKGILRKAQEYSDDEIKRLVDDGYLHEYFNERGEQVYRLTDKGKAVRNEISQASFKDLAIYSDKKAFADVLKKAGINADKDTEEIAHFFVKWFQENTVNLAEKIPMSEKQLQKMKYQWGKYFPKQRATLSETGLRKIMDNPEIYTKEQVELATNIHNSIKNPKVLGVKVVEYRKNLADAIQRNVDLSDNGIKVPRQWQAEAGLPYNKDLRISADARDLVETQYLRSWAFNRSNKEFSDLLQAGRVGVKNVDLVNLTSRVMSKKYDAILPYITNPTDVLQGVMSKVTNTLRMNDAFENLAKHTEYVRTDLDPKLHGTSYTDVVDGVGVTYKYINPEQTEYLSLAGKYVNENVLRSIQTRIDGSAQSLSKFSLDSTWSKFLRPVWYAGMTSSNLSYHAINMVTSGVNMLLHAPQLGLRPFSVAKTSLKWFKTLGSPKLRREFADEIQDMIEHQIIGQENIAVNPKSYGTITRGNIGAFEINKTINKVGVTIQEILDMAPAFANMSDQLARITYYQEKINDLKKIMQKADYKALSPEQQADFVAQFKAKAADQAQTIIPSYIDTANALRAVNEVMPLMSWGMKAYKIPYRNLMTLLGKNDIKGFGKLSKSINMTEKAKAAFALIGLPALAGYYAYNKVQTNREQAMAEAGTTPEYRNNFYDQKWCKMIPSIEDLFERQEDYLAAKYVIDAVFNRSFSFETKEGIVKVSGSNYGERYRLPEFSSPLVTYGNIIFSGTKVNPFTGTGEPITDKEGWERAKDLLAYTIFVSSANSQRYNSEVRRLKKKGMDEKQAKIQAYAKMIDPETLLRYDIITQEDLIKRTKGEHYRLKKQIAGLKKMTPEEQQKAIPGIERQGERVRIRADLIDYLPKGKEE